MTRLEAVTTLLSMPLYIDYPSWLDPYVVSFLPIRWYAVMYIVAFAVAWLLYRWQLKRDPGPGISKEESENLFIWAVIGLLIGARLFSVFFYSDGWYYLTHPWMIFWPFRDGRFVGLPGMSYHGGVVGALVAGWIYARRRKFNFLRQVDLIVTGIPLGYTFGRLGNFINGELYGRVTSVPWGMIFPTAPSFDSSLPWVQEVASRVGMDIAGQAYVNLPRHPSQLYEALFEGLVLFLVLWFICRPLIRRKSLKPGSMLSFYVFGYGFVRFLIEYCRQPDADIGYVMALGAESDNIAVFQSFLNISQGQVFCLLMMAAAIVFFIYINRRKAYVGKQGHAKAGKAQKRNGR